MLQNLEVAEMRGKREPVFLTPDSILNVLGAGVRDVNKNEVILIGSHVTVAGIDMERTAGILGGQDNVALGVHALGPFDNLGGLFQHITKRLLLILCIEPEGVGACLANSVMSEVPTQETRAVHMVNAVTRGLERHITFLLFVLSINQLYYNEEENANSPRCIDLRRKAEYNKTDSKRSIPLVVRR